MSIGLGLMSINVTVQCAKTSIAACGVMVQLPRALYRIETTHGQDIVMAHHIARGAILREFPLNP
jgi:hypothetical protein